MAGEEVASKDFFSDPSALGAGMVNACRRRFLTWQASSSCVLRRRRARVTTTLNSPSGCSLIFLKPFHNVSYDMTPVGL